MKSSVVPLFQAIDLVFCILWHSTTLLLFGLPSALVHCIYRSRPKVGDKTSLSPRSARRCCYYEGIVSHARMAPVKNSFR